MGFTKKMAEDQWVTWGYNLYNWELWSPPTFLTGFFGPTQPITNSSPLKMDVFRGYGMLVSGSVPGILCQSEWVMVESPLDQKLTAGV